MEGSSPKSLDLGESASNASSFLANLPSRGLFSSAVISTSPEGMRVYVCEHDTSPPEDQHITTNQQNLLVRSLTHKKQKTFTSGLKVKKAATTKGSTNRTGLRSLDGRGSANRAVLDKSSSLVSDNDYQKLTVDRLRALLKEKHRSTKGKKDELIERLKAANN